KIMDLAHLPPQAEMLAVYYLEVVGLPRSSILASLDKELSGAPLMMTTRTVKSDRVMAMAPKRFSRVLSGGWFEWVQVLVELDREFGVEVSVDLVVNKQNTAEPADWHLPTDPQLDQYRQALIGTVNRALTSVCVEPKWNGS